MNILSWPQTPLGPLWGELDSQSRLTALRWGTPPASHTVVAGHPAHTALAEYFTDPGKPPALLHKHFAPQGTPFQQKVWHALLDIPAGITRTYGDLAAALNSSPRAVGGAVGANPIPILIPCHRVMGAPRLSARGQAVPNLTGFSAPGGIQTKSWLLKHEGVLLA